MMETPEQTTKPDMTVHAAEGLDMGSLGKIVAMCYDKGGWMQAIVFTGNKVRPTMDPKVFESEGVYSAIWMLPKEPESGDNGKALKLADAGEE